MECIQFDRKSYQNANKHIKVNALTEVSINESMEISMENNCVYSKSTQL